MTHDANVFPDPFTFYPERFLGEKPQPDPKQFVFGFGRRYVNLSGGSMKDAVLR